MVGTKKVLKGVVPIAIPLNAPETKSTFLPLLHDYFHFSVYLMDFLKDKKLATIYQQQPFISW